MIIFFQRIAYFFPFLWKLLWSRDVPLKSKLAFIFGGLYLISFVDLIPDLIPFLGIIDDSIITTAFIVLGLLGVPKLTLEKVWNLVTKKITIEAIK